MEGFLHNLFGGTGAGGAGRGDGNNGGGRGAGGGGYPGAAYAAAQGGLGRGDGRGELPPGRGPNASDVERMLQELAAAAMGLGGAAFYPGGPTGMVQVDNEGWEVPPEEWLSQEHERPMGPPPTSRRAVARLPEVVLTEADLAVDTNEECAVCMEAHKVGGKALKLPCQHCFHKACVLLWLEKHNTCPTCRFELETDDRDYERERRKRMKTRKIRLRPGELERKGVGELKRLLDQLGVPTTGCLEKQDMVQRLLESGLVEIMAAATATAGEGGGGEAEDGKMPAPAPPAPASAPAQEDGAGSSSSSSSSSHDHSGGASGEPTALAKGEEGGAAFVPPPAPSPPAPGTATDVAEASRDGAGQEEGDGLDKMSIGELRRLMRRLVVSDAGCLEKSDMVDALRASGRLPSSASS